MNFVDMTNKMITTDHYNHWLSRNHYYQIVQPNCLSIQLTNLCNLNCECCPMIDKKPVPFDYQKCYSFVDRMMYSSKILGYKSYDINLTGGEVTVLKANKLLEILDIIYSLSIKHKLKLTIGMNTNLFDISSEHLEFFKICQEINAKNGLLQGHVIRTSNDKLHYVNTTRHLINIKRINQIGIIPTITAIVDGTEDIDIIHNDYKDIKAVFQLTYRKDWGDLELNHSYYEKTKLYKNVRLYYSYLTYSHNNQITLCYYPAGHKEFNIDPDNIIDYNQLYSYPLFQYISYLYYFTMLHNLDPRKKCPITFYYEKIFK